MKYTSIVTLIIIVFLVSFTLFFKKGDSGLVELKINDVEVQIELADTIAKRTLGLSGRDFLSENRGMFFIFDEPGFYSFWMRDMNFAIDIIWIDENFNIIDITKNVTPESFPKTFKPQEPVKYVLEVNSGWAGNNSIKVGDIVHR